MLVRESGRGFGLTKGRSGGTLESILDVKTRPMSKYTILLVTLLVIGLSAAARAQQRILSVCDYEPPESRISDLGLQGSFSWFDGPFADDRNRAFAATLTSDYNGLYSSNSYAQRLDAHAEFRANTGGWTADLEGAGSLLSFLNEDVFAVGVFGIDASNDVRLEVDLTGGVGTGRFRDVTPLAQAIRIQNALLDLGELLAPVSNAALLDLARILGEVGPTADKRFVALVERLEETELLRSEGLDVRGLLEIDRILAEPGISRLCGSDAQIRLGATAMLIPELRISATGILLGRYALVPDPVSQVEASAQAKIRVAEPDQMSITGDLSYVRRLPDGWTARAAYRLDIDRMWTTSDATTIMHGLSSSLTTQVLGSVGLSLVANAEHRTGDEEITFSLGVHLEADL